MPLILLWVCLDYSFLVMHDPQYKKLLVLPADFPFPFPFPILFFVGLNPKLSLLLETSPYSALKPLGRSLLSIVFVQLRVKYDTRSHWLLWVMKLCIKKDIELPNKLRNKVI